MYIAFCICLLRDHSGPSIVNNGAKTMDSGSEQPLNQSLETNTPQELFNTTNEKQCTKVETMIDSDTNSSVQGQSRSYDTDTDSTTEDLENVTAGYPEGGIEAANLCKECSKGQAVTKLQRTIEDLQRQLSAREAFLEPEPELIPRIFVLHRVFCRCGQDDRFGGNRNYRKTVYRDLPYRVTGDKKWHLQGRLNAPDQAVFLEQNTDIVLLIYKDYKCHEDAAQFVWAGTNEENQAESDSGKKAPSACAESMLSSSNVLVEAMKWATLDIGTAGTKRDFPILTEVKAPYHYFYYGRTSIRQRILRMEEDHQTLVKLFIGYVEESFEQMYNEARSLFSQGLVSVETIPYLFEPEMLVVYQLAGENVALQTKCWMEDISALSEPTQPGEIGFIRCWSWIFDGTFQKRSLDFKISWPGFIRGTQPIKGLPIYPLKYLDHSVETQLFERGEKFWMCRNRVYISYNNEEMMGDTVEVSRKVPLPTILGQFNTLSQRGARYMIDVAMHKILNATPYLRQPQDETVEPKSLVGKPSREFFLLLPSQVYGYSMQTKNWGRSRDFA